MVESKNTVHNAKGVQRELNEAARPTNADIVRFFHDCLGRVAKKFESSPAVIMSLSYHNLPVNVRAVAADNQLAATSGESAMVPTAQTRRPNASSKTFS